MDFGDDFFDDYVHYDDYDCIYDQLALEQVIYEEDRNRRININDNVDDLFKANKEKIMEINNMTRGGMTILKIVL